MTTIDPQHADELVYEADNGDTVGPWTRVAMEEGENRRWMQSRAIILTDADGAFWSLDYDHGLTEEQPDELPWRDPRGPVELTRVYPHVVTSTTYSTAPPRSAV